jgi:hypothetical protein
MSGRHTATLATFLSLTCLPGCGGNAQVEVEGSVTYDGQPIKAGTIAFMATDEKARNAGGTILDGKYRIPAERGPRPGSFRIEIRWAKPTGKKYTSEIGAVLESTEEGLPAKYHDKSQLTAEVKPGKNTLDFNLQK